MSNVEHLFENAIVALENDYYFGEWKRTETEIHNTDGVSEEVLEVIWELAIYTKYTYEPSLNALNAIPVEWIEKQMAEREDYGDFNTAAAIGYLLLSWEKENEQVSSKN